MRILPPVVFRLVLIKPARFSFHLASVGGDAHPPGDGWGNSWSCSPALAVSSLALFWPLRSLCGDSILSLYTILYIHYIFTLYTFFIIFIRGLPSNIMRRVLRSFYDEDLTDHSLFEQNMLPVRRPKPASTVPTRPTFVGPELPLLPLIELSRSPASIVNDTDFPRTPAWDDPSDSVCVRSSDFPY